MRVYDRNVTEIVCTTTREQYDRQQDEVPVVHFVAPDAYAWTGE